MHKDYFGLKVTEKSTDSGRLLEFPKTRAQMLHYKDFSPIPKNFVWGWEVAGNGTPRPSALPLIYAHSPRRVTLYW